ncbi:MAG: asparagine synthase (glutamine-hydrolyzing) [Bryobacterales bacterium]
MCGICGRLNFDDRPVTADEIARMAGTLHHRGPDDAGSHVDGPAGIGIARLSILDVVGGHQPISNEDATVWVVSNGEIYNHRELRAELEAKGHVFRTGNDAEVAVHLYEEAGPGCASRLRGMFAIAVWDSRVRKLTLIRDRLGVKPLYLYRDRNTLLFGSELKALIAAGMPRQIEAQGVRDYLSYGYLPGPASIFRGVEKLAPAHTLSVDATGSTTLARYWDLREASNEIDVPSDERERGAAFWELFREAVKVRLESDVPLGVLLSGGVDSAAIVAAYREVTSAPLATFTVGFPEQSFDESRLARLTAERYQTEHHELIAEPKAAQTIEAYTQAFDEPYGESSAIPIYYVAGLARQHITVALGGDGGDEALGGYNHYAAAGYLERYRRLPNLLSQSVIPWVANRLPVSHRRASFSYLARRFTAAATMTREEAHLEWISVVDAATTEAIAGDALRGLAPPLRYLEAAYKRAQGLDPINSALYADAQVYLREGILQKVDRMTMAHGLEARGPLLDQRLVAFALGVPGGDKIRGGVRKHFFKRLLRDRLPAETLKQKKMGFVPPLAKWLCGDLREALLDSLTPKTLAETGYFKPKAVQRLIDEHLALRRDHSRALWGLLAFERWRRRWAAP